MKIAHLLTFIIYFNSLSHPNSTVIFLSQVTTRLYHFPWKILTTIVKIRKSSKSFKAPVWVKSTRHLSLKSSPCIWHAFFGPHHSPNQLGPKHPAYQTTVWILFGPIWPSIKERQLLPNPNHSSSFLSVLSLPCLFHSTFNNLILFFLLFQWCVKYKFRSSVLFYMSTHLSCIFF